MAARANKLFWLAEISKIFFSETTGLDYSIVEMFIRWSGTIHVF
jgi:hypothetical protein